MREESSLLETVMRVFFFRAFHNLKPQIETRAYFHYVETTVSI